MTASPTRARDRRRPSTLEAIATLGLLGLLAPGCAGASPLLHPARALAAGQVTVGAGLAAQVAAIEVEPIAEGDASTQVLEDFAVAPGVSPWAGGRVGIEGENEAGLTYMGRSIRVDGRHVFPVGPLQLSLGAGASAIVPRPRGGDLDLGSAYGGGGDVPVLLGWTSDAGIYSVWAGPRGGFEILGGQVVESELRPSTGSPEPVPFSGRSFFAGGLVGAMVGFRSIHVAVEVDVAWRRAEGTFGQGGSQADLAFDQLAITPASALILTL